MTGLEVVTGDLDGNGRDDIFARYPTAGGSRRSLTAMVTISIRYGLGLGPGHAYAADFNADGRADVFVYDAPTGQWTMAFSGRAGVARRTDRRAHGRRAGSQSSRA